MSGADGVKRYWFCQIGGWAAYAGLNAALFAGALGPSPRLFVSTFGTGALGLVVSHQYRRVIRARRWLELRPAALVPRLFGASVVQGAALVGWILLVRSWLGAAGEASPVTLVGALALLFNMTVVFVSWSLLYVGAALYARSRAAERARWQLEAAARASELHALKAQMNPHFLFNALNGLRGLIAEDPERASAMVTELASLLRYSLGAGASHTVPLERELEAVRAYLAIESVRFEERLRVHIDVPQATLAVPVPVLLLQTLVENAIKHGIARRADGGEVHVVAHIEGDALWIEVSNPAADGGDAPRGEGIGLTNAAERLKLLYGDRASVSLERAGAARTKAVLRLPLPENLTMKSAAPGALP